MTENNKNRFTDNETDCLIDSSFTDNLTKKIYVIDEWERIIGLCNNLWEQTQRFEKENQRLNTEIEQLKKELSEYKDFVFSDDKILCYTCLFCTHKGIYEVDCDMKGHVDVHGFCFSYTKKELQE